MGLGQVMGESMNYRGSRLFNPSLLEYKVLAPQQMPEVEILLVGDDDPEGPFGAKEAGEGPLIATLPAVGNALYDAIGCRFTELPITPDRVSGRSTSGRRKDAAGRGRRPCTWTRSNCTGPPPSRRRYASPGRWPGGSITSREGRTSCRTTRCTSTSSRTSSPSRTWPSFAGPPRPSRGDGASRRPGARPCVARGMAVGRGRGPRGGDAARARERNGRRQPSP